MEERRCETQEVLGVRMDIGALIQDLSPIIVAGEDSPEEYLHIQRGWKMSKLFVISIEKDIGVMGHGRSEEGVPLSCPPCWTCPKDQAQAGAAGASALS